MAAMDSIRRIVLQSEIAALKAQYFRLMDTKKWDQWRGLFTDDIVVVVDTAVSTGGRSGEPLPTRRGVDEFTATTRQAIEDCTTVHHGHMPEIQIISETEATGIWAMEDIVEHPNGRRFQGHGHYHEKYRKKDGQWRIYSLHLTRLRVFESEVK
jgi:hypothetical protein